MARVSNQDLLNRYLKRIETSKQWRKTEGYDDTWRRLNDMYRGRHYEHYSDEDRLVVNIAFSTINVVAPSVAINYPQITVSATKPDNAPNAVITEAVVNYWMKHYNIKPEFRRAVKDSLIFGHGWIKVGYRFVEEDAVGGDEDISDPLVSDGISSPNTVVLEDRPFVERVSPFDMFVDPDATSMNDIRWIAQRIRRPIAEIRSDKRYNKTAREMVQPSTYSKWSDHSANKKIYDQSQGYAEVWEYYDLHRNTVSVFADSCDYFLIKPTKMPYAFGHPYTMLRDYDVPDTFYPIGELEAIEPLQKELNQTRTDMLNHRKRFSRKYLYKESAFDNLGRQALESDEDNTMVPVVTDESLMGVVAPFPAVINPPEFYDQSALITADIDRISGITEMQRGGGVEIRRTATEAGIIQDSANARLADKLAMVEVALAEVARRLIQLAQQFMSGEAVARIVGKDGVEAWVQFDRDYIAGDFDYEVAAGSTQPTNESFRRQSALQMMDAIAPLAGAGVVDMRKLASHVLQNGFGIKNPDEFLMPEQPPMPEMPPQSTAPTPPPEPVVAPEMPIPPMPPEAGMGQMLPPELMAAMAGGSPPSMGGPDMSQLPPELLQAILAQQQGGMPPEMPF